MSLELIARINELGHSPSCVLKVLDDILPHCNTPEDIADRTWLGVQLSICEFDAAGIAYPNSCKQFNTLMECTGLLESKATWWTTFSGNYRSIATICSEYRSEYEFENIVRLYQNISSAMYDHYKGHEETLVVFKHKFDEAVEIANNWRTNLDSLTEELEHLRGDLTNTSQLMNSMPQNLLKFSDGLDRLDKRSTNIYSTLYNVETAAENIAKDMSLYYQQLNANHLVLVSYETELTNIKAMLLALGNISENLAVRNTVLISKLDAMVNRLDIYDNRQNKSVTLLESVVSSSTSRLELATSNLETSVTKVRGFLLVLRSFSTTVHFVFYGLLVGLIWRLLSMYRHHIPEEDLAFY